MNSIEKAAKEALEKHLESRGNKHIERESAGFREAYKVVYQSGFADGFEAGMNAAQAGLS